ncbi:MAG: aldehyde ferredoxin oxidoreductase [Candidatus Heimdallarchaeota archaeon]|nr:MAG: aldehyde ferredoxin oxidoreductase [Candidatus Heimdallarchaeota archaeon]
MSKILRINMSTLEHGFEDVPEKYQTLGGRALTSNVIFDEVDPTCDPLGPDNKFVVAPGLLAGTDAPSSGRLSVGGKSPLTNGIKEANAGGPTAQKLGRLGIKGIIIEGKAEEDTWYNIVLSKDKCEIVEAGKYAGMGLYELITKVWEEYPNKPGIIGCGIAGQKLMKSAGVFGNNVENSDPGRYAGRGGLGAVLGSKRVSAIITDDTGTRNLRPADRELYTTGCSKLLDALDEHAVTGVLEKPDPETGKMKPYGALKNYGTNVLQNIINEAGALPTRNWHEGRFEGATKISGEAVHEFIDKVKEKFPDSTATYAHACHDGCVMKCSNIVPYEDTGEHQVGCLEYESVWALGTNCGIDDLFYVAELNRVCNDLGIDTIEAGNIISVAMDGKIEIDGKKLDFGDGALSVELLKKVTTNEPLAKAVGDGALAMGKYAGITHVAAVKGQSLPAYDPRPIKGIGVTYATGPQGGCHTQGYTIAPEILQIGGKPDPRDIKKAELSRGFQATTAYIDSTGYCLFIAFAILDIESGLNGMVESINGFLGTEIDVGKYGADIISKEREFNKRAGMTEKDDRLPEFFKTEPLPPHNVVFDVPDEELDSVHQD